MQIGAIVHFIQYHTYCQRCAGPRSSIPDPVREPDFLDRDRIAIQFEKPWIGTVRIGVSLRIFRTNPNTRIEAICLYASGNPSA